MIDKSGKPVYVACVSNDGYEVSLVTRRIYRSLPDFEASRRGCLRVVDETGEDYLFPASLFVIIEIPREIEAVFEKAG